MELLEILKIILRKFLICLLVAIIFYSPYYTSLIKLKRLKNIKAKLKKDPYAKMNNALGRKIKRNYNEFIDKCEKIIENIVSNNENENNKNPLSNEDKWRYYLNENTCKHESLYKTKKDDWKDFSKPALLFCTIFTVLICLAVVIDN